MAMAGRKPKPTALKVLEGDRGKGRRPLNEHEPIPPRGGVKCPSWLLPEAKKEWKRLAASLEAMGVLTMADLTAFAGYCQAYARWREAEDLALFKKFCKRDFCDEVRDFKIPEPEAVAS